MSVVVDAKTTSLVKMGYGELALKEETDGMAEINLWDLIVVKLSELGILKRFIIYEALTAKMRYPAHPVKSLFWCLSRTYWKTLSNAPSDAF